MFGASEFYNREDRIVSVSNVCYFDIRKAALPTITVGLQGRYGRTEHDKNQILG
jgi:hypothetical protein